MTDTYDRARRRRAIWVALMPGNYGAPTTLALTTSPNPSLNGTSVTITATVATATGTPTGTVTLFDGATSLGTQSLIGMSAIRMTSTLTLGSHPLTAQYNGDPNYSGSTSNQVVHVVN
jgi:Bacterial Ig-like domain (group 3)